MNHKGRNAFLPNPLKAEGVFQETSYLIQLESKVKSKAPHDRTCGSKKSAFGELSSQVFPGMCEILSSTASTYKKRKKLLLVGMYWLSQHTSFGGTYQLSAYELFFKNLL